jgi:hypothetical protein
LAIDSFPLTAQSPAGTFRVASGISVAASSKIRMPTQLPVRVFPFNSPPRDSRAKMPRLNPSTWLPAMVARASSESPEEMPAVPLLGRSAVPRSTPISTLSTMRLWVESAARMPYLSCP